MKPDIGTAALDGSKSLCFSSTMKLSSRPNSHCRKKSQASQLSCGPGLGGAQWYVRGWPKKATPLPGRVRWFVCVDSFHQSAELSTSAQHLPVAPLLMHRLGLSQEPYT